MKSRLGKADSIFKSTKTDKAAAGKVMDAPIEMQSTGRSDG